MLAPCGYRRRPGPSGPRRPRSGTGCRGRRTAARRAARPHHARPAAKPLGVPDSGSGHRLTSSAYSAAPMPRMSSSGVASGMRRGKGQHDIAVDADAHPAGVVDGQRDAGLVCRFGGRGQRLDGPRTADRGRRGVGDLLQRAAADPLRHHQATRTGVGDVEYPRDAGTVDAAQPQCAGQDLLHCSSGSSAVGVDEGQRHLAVQRGVERLPELQGGRAAVEHQQPVAAAGDAGAGDQVDIVFGRRRAAPARGRGVNGDRRGTRPDSPRPDQAGSRRRSAAAAWSWRRPAGRPMGSSVTSAPSAIAPATLAGVRVSERLRGRPTAPRRTNSSAQGT